MNADDPWRKDMAELARMVPAPAERDLPAGRQRSLQPVNQLLNIFLRERLEQSPSQRRQSAHDLRLAFPEHLRSARSAFEIKPGANSGRAAGHIPLALIHRVTRPVCLEKSHLYLRVPSNMRYPHAKAHGEMLLVIFLHALKIRKQWAEALRVRQKLEDFLRFFADCEAAAKADVHLPLFPPQG